MSQLNISNSRPNGALVGYSSLQNIDAALSHANIYGQALNQRSIRVEKFAGDVEYNRATRPAAFYPAKFYDSTTMK